MRYSRMFIPTVKEVPADAEVISHQLMIRAGLARKVASGTYTYLPLGLRCLLKIIAIVREEINRAGAQEILVPSMQPKELWDRTGRSTDYGPTMFCLKDRHGRMNVLGPTAEEVVTFLASGEVNSYKQLPFNLYQISAKFRDEFRPRFGAIRSREFIMKDAYSFDADAAGLDKSYKAMYDAYCRIFTRCGIEYVIVEAEVGEMGGSGSHQFTVPCESGEDTIVYAEDGSYAANLERASIDPLPKAAAAGEIPPIQEVHTPNIGSIEAVCAFLNTKPEQMVKTLIYWSGNEQDISKLIRDMKRVIKSLTDLLKSSQDQELDRIIVPDGVREIFSSLLQCSESISPCEDMPSYSESISFSEFASKFEKLVNADTNHLGKRFITSWQNLKTLLCAFQDTWSKSIVVLLRGDHEVNEEKLRSYIGCEAHLAPPLIVFLTTMAKVGFAGPFGLVDKVSKMVIDHSVAAMTVGVTGANKTDYHIKNVVPGRDFSLEGDNVVLADIRFAQEGDTYNGKKLLFKKGIEIGQVFKLGTKYSVKLGAKFLDEQGEEKPCIMGCYGIGINRILASAIELGNDENGIIWPISIAPFEVIVTCVNQDEEEVSKVAEDIYQKLIDSGVDVLLDDRIMRAGGKFKDADLIGIPIRITVGKKALAEGNVEIKLRSESASERVPVDEVIGKANELIDSLKEKLNA